MTTKQARITDLAGFNRVRVRDLPSASRITGWAEIASVRTDAQGLLWVDGLWWTRPRWSWNWTSYPVALFAEADTIAAWIPQGGGGYIADLEDCQGEPSRWQPLARVLADDEAAVALDLTTDKLRALAEKFGYEPY
ncbi:hypothetical protein ACIBF1_07830 [Spirillospora sp. NPDC050679]